MVFVGQYLSQEVSGVYLNVSVTNPDGGFENMYEPIFATNDCPEQGTLCILIVINFVIGYYGRGLNCTTCPHGGFCPGGNRVWPLPGFYAVGDLPPVFGCDPPEACLGGRGSPCAIAYEGIGCGACSDGFYRDHKVYCYKCGAQSMVAVLLLIQVNK